MTVGFISSFYYTSKLFSNSK